MTDDLGDRLAPYGDPSLDPPAWSAADFPAPPPGPASPLYWTADDGYRWPPPARRWRRWLARIGLCAALCAALVACGGGGQDVKVGARFETDYGTATVVDHYGRVALAFPDCTDAMRAAGDGRLVDFDPEADAGIPAPPYEGGWIWNCG